MTLNERVAFALGWKKIPTDSGHGSARCALTGFYWHPPEGSPYDEPPDVEHSADAALAAYAEIKKRGGWQVAQVMDGWISGWNVRLRQRITTEEVEATGPTFAAALSEAVAKAGERDAKS